MNVIFYRNTSDNRAVNKNLEELFTSNCRIHGENSVMNPSLILETNTNSFNANYCYIPDLARYYYIKDWKLDAGLRIVFNCHVDVLQTYKSEISANAGVVVRNEMIGSNYIVDDQIPLDTRQSVDVYKFATSPFNINSAGATSDNFVLNVAGGGEGVTPTPKPEPTTTTDGGVNK